MNPNEIAEWIGVGVLAVIGIFIIAYIVFMIAMFYRTWKD